MELCTARSTFSTIPRYSGIPTLSNHFPLKSNVSKISSSSFNPLGSPYYTKLTMKSSMSEETTGTTTSLYGKDRPDGMITMEDIKQVEKEYAENVQNKATEETSEENQTFELFEKLDLKIDSDDRYSILLLGGGSLVALYLAISVVNAIDSVPVIPKLMEVVGLSYTLWFSTRYLLFKKNREELAARIEEIKQQVLGYDD